MKTYITSDFHFNHDKIAPLRGFESTEAMNEHLIKYWNDTVNPEDTIYHLGDFCFKPATTFYDTIEKLNGNKIFIMGNHDNEDYFLRSVLNFDNLISYWDYKEISYNKNRIILFHFPITVWNLIADGSLHFHGHTHGGHQGEGRCMDVGYDMHNRIITMEEAIDMVKDKPIIKRHYKK
jgi:calcineurin-like phosphoesterase family protein